MKKAKRSDSLSLDEIIGELTAEAHDDDERIRNFQQALQTHLWLPCDGFVIGEPVTVIKFNYDGNQRRALTATCRRSDGREYELTATEVLVPADIAGSQYVVAYRQWMGLEPGLSPERRARDHVRHGDGEAPIDLRGLIELIVLSVKQKAARCRLLGGEQTFTFRAGGLWELVPGEIAIVKPAQAVDLCGESLFVRSNRVHSARCEGAGVGPSAAGESRPLESCGALLGGRG